MPIDVDAQVISNTRLSDDYSVVALAAPEIASLAEPGQFVMIKPCAGVDPLLRRPFSIFEILRDASGTPTGISLLNKRIGVGTSLLYDATPGSRLGCLGPLGRPFEPVDAAGGSLDGGGRRRARAVRDAVRSAAGTRHESPPLLRCAKERRSHARRSLRTTRGRAGSRDRRRQPRDARVRDRATRGGVAGHATRRRKSACTRAARHP